MKTIIAGTDFTASSVNACRYAALLAEKLNCRLVLFNLFEAPVIHSNVGLYGFSYTSVRKNSQLKTGKIIEKLQKQFPKTQISMFVSSGSFKAELEDFTSRHQVEMAVMGLAAKDRISKFIYGSHGVNIAGRINAPVVIVPESYKQHKIEHVLLAVDNTEKLYKSSLSRFEKFIHTSKARLQLLHVRTEDEIMDPVMISLKINGKRKKIDIVKAQDLQEGLKTYCKDNNYDLIAIVSKKHSAFYNLFVESNTKKVAFVTKVPVLSIHE